MGFPRYKLGDMGSGVNGRTLTFALTFALTLPAGPHQETEAKARKEGKLVLTHRSCRGSPSSAGGCCLRGPCG